MPINIDGTDVSGITIDGTDVTEVTVDGDVVWTAISDSGVSRWTFDSADTSGSTAVDSWGSTDGTINGATTGVSGANQTYTTNEAYDFDGTDDYVDLGTTIPSSPNGDFTISFWFRTTTNSRGVLFGQRDTNDTDAVFSIELRADEIDQIQVNEFANSGREFIDSAGGLNDGVWRMVTVTREVGDMRLYIDGSQSGTAGTRAADYNDATSIGRRGGSGGGDRYFDGQVDDVRYYSKPLTSSEVSDLYNTGLI